MPNRRHLLAGLAAAPLVLRRARGQAESWPTRAIRLVVPYGAAGSTDAVGRLLADRLAPILGHPVVVENRPGLAGTIGVDLVAKSAPDGHTLGLVTNNQTANETLQPHLPYRLLRDLAPIAAVDAYALVLAVNPALPAATVPALIAHARAHPGELDYASSGPGSIFHVAAEVFAHRAGITLQHVPFRDYNAARTALMAGDVALMFDAIFTMQPLFEGGRVRALATTGAARSPLLPALPTVAETLPGFEAVLWNGLVGPAGVPPAIVERLNAAVNRVLAEPAVVAAQTRTGAATTPMSVTAFADFLRGDVARQREAVGLAGIQPEP